MNSKCSVFLMAAVSVGSAVCVSQTSQTRTDTPKIIEIVTEQTPSAAESGMKALLLKLKAQHSADLHWIGATVIAGDLNRTVAIFQHANYASVQQSSQAMHAAWESLAPAQRPVLQSHVYAFTPDQSYNDGHVSWADARAFVLLSVSLSTGGYDDYAEQQQVASEYLVKAKIQNEEWLGFSQHYGPEYPAYLFVTPLRSVSDLDITENHGPILPEWVDRGRDTVLLKSVKSNSVDLLLVDRQLSSAP